MVNDSQTSQPSIPAVEELCWFVANALSRPVRTLTEFAEQELILPYDGGPHEGEAFSFDHQPFTQLLTQEIDVGPWTEFVITGPSQSGKTLICFVLLIAYTAAELRRNIVVGVPDKDMANDKWKIDIEPVFKAAPLLARLLPTSGPGSKGGAVRDTVTLTNGVVIKFMAPGGDDSNKAGFTAKTVVVTEAARFSDPGRKSVEADPLRQLKARQRATSRFTKDRKLLTERRLFVEGTVTLEDELPWKAKPGSTASRIVCECPHCVNWVTVERENFTGWEDAENELDAAETASFFCPDCGQCLSDDDRLEMNRRALLVHEGQSVKKGKVTGKAPRTSRLFFRWNAFNNMFVSAGDLGAEEWSAAQFSEDSAERANAEKDLSQSIWCQPYQPLLIDAMPLKASELSKRKGPLPYGVIPSDARFVTMGVDLGRWTCWWFTLVAREIGELYCPAYGSVNTSLFESKRRGDEISTVHEQQAVHEALMEIGARAERGWIVDGSGEMKTPDQIFMDRGWRADVVFAFCQSKGKGRLNQFMPVLGLGKSQFENRKYTRPSRQTPEVPVIGEGWHQKFDASRPGWEVEIDADNAKVSLQSCLRVEPGNAGALTIALSDKAGDHKKVCRHLSSEVRRQVMDPEKGLVEEWLKVGQNHWLDCAAYALAALRFKGWGIQESPESDAPKRNSWFAKAREASKRA